MSGLPGSGPTPHNVVSGPRRSEPRRAHTAAGRPMSDPALSPAAHNAGRPVSGLARWGRTMSGSARRKPSHIQSARCWPSRVWPRPTRRTMSSSARGGPTVSDPALGRPRTTRTEPCPARTMRADPCRAPDDASGAMPSPAPTSRRRLSTTRPPVHSNPVTSPFRHPQPIDWRHEGCPRRGWGLPSTGARAGARFGGCGGAVGRGPGVCGGWRTAWSALCCGSVTGCETASWRQPDQ
jgi:hypothetical protein